MVNGTYIYIPSNGIWTQQQFIALTKDFNLGLYMCVMGKEHVPKGKCVLLFCAGFEWINHNPIIS